MTNSTANHSAAAPILTRNSPPPAKPAKQTDSRPNSPAQLQILYPISIPSFCPSSPPLNAVHTAHPAREDPPSVGIPLLPPPLRPAVRPLPHLLHPTRLCAGGWRALRTAQRQRLPHHPVLPARGIAMGVPSGRVRAAGDRRQRVLRRPTNFQARPAPGVGMAVSTEVVPAAAPHRRPTGRSTHLRNPGEFWDGQCASSRTSFVHQ